MNRYDTDGSRPGAQVMSFFMMIYQNLFELVCLNLFFICSCLPVVTIPWAAVALTDTMAAMCRDDETHLLMRYWRSLTHPVRGRYWTVLPMLLLEGFLGTGLMIYIGAGNASPLLWIGCGLNAAAFGGSILFGMYLIPWMLRSGECGRLAWKRTFWICMARLLHSVPALAGIGLIWILWLRHFRRWWVLFLLIVISLSALIGTHCAERNIGAFILEVENREADGDQNNDGGEHTCIGS